MLYRRSPAALRLAAPRECCAPSQPSGGRVCVRFECTGKPNTASELTRKVRRNGRTQIVRLGNWPTSRVVRGGSERLLLRILVGSVACCRLSGARPDVVRHVDFRSRALPAADCARRKASADFLAFLRHAAPRAFRDEFAKMSALQRHPDSLTYVQRSSSRSATSRCNGGRRLEGAGARSVASTPGRDAMYCGRRHPFLERRGDRLRLRRC
jgi:hypothetical protein